MCVEKEKGGGEGSHFGPESTLIQSFDCSVSLSEKDSEIQRDTWRFFVKI